MFIGQNVQSVYLLGRGLLPSCGAVTVGVETGVRLVDLTPVVLPDRACFFGEPLRSYTVGPTDCERTKFELNSVKIVVLGVGGRKHLDIQKIRFLPLTRFFGLLLGLIVLAVFCGLPLGIAGISFSRVGEISKEMSSSSVNVLEKLLNFEKF